MPSAHRAVPASAGRGTSLKPLSGNVCLRPLSATYRAVPASASQTPLGERVPSADTRCAPMCARRVVSNPSRGTCAFGPMCFVWRAAFAHHVSNPSRGTCAFGPDGGAFASISFMLSQTPLGERVPSALMVAHLHPYRSCCLKPLSGNVCLRPCQCTHAITLCTSLKPLSGNVCLRPEAPKVKAKPLPRSQTPLGERVPSAKQGHMAIRGGTESSQTPLGERVPSALSRYPGAAVHAPGSQTPLGERVPSAVTMTPAWNNCATSQTPLGERVPSAKKTTSWYQRGQTSLKPLSGNVCLRPKLIREGVVRFLSLKPLSGNVCLRPPCARLGASPSQSVSNPSRGTCAFGLKPSRKKEKENQLSQTPLGERVPSALSQMNASCLKRAVSNPSRGTCAFGR